MPERIGFFTTHYSLLTTHYSLPPRYQCRREAHDTLMSIGTYRYYSKEEIINYDILQGKVAEAPNISGVLPLW